MEVVQRKDDVLQSLAHPGFENRSGVTPVNY
jgi:hypothetical protein